MRERVLQHLPVVDLLVLSWPKKFSESSFQNTSREIGIKQKFLQVQQKF